MCSNCDMAVVKWPFSQFFSLYEGHEAKFFGCGDDSTQGFPFLSFVLFCFGPFWSVFPAQSTCL